MSGNSHQVSRALIVEDLPAAQAWLRGALELAFPGVLVEVSGLLDDARQRLRATLPDIVLLDLNLPDGDGTTLLAELRRLPRPPMRVVTTVYDDDRHLLPVLRLGIDGYLMKERDQAEIADALRHVANGEPALSPGIARRMLEAFVSPVDRDTVALTPREEDVLARLSQGDRIADIADALHISYHTAATHVRRVYAKLDVKSRAAVVSEALRRGLVRAPH